MTGSIELEGAGPPVGVPVDVYQDRISYDGPFGGRSRSKEHRHVVGTDESGRFSLWLTAPGEYQVLVSGKPSYHYVRCNVTAVLREKRDLYIELREFREAEVRWCYIPGASGSFVGEKVVEGEAVLSPGPLDRVTFTREGLQELDRESDFLVIQKHDQVYIRNFDVCGSGHGLIDFGSVDFDAVVQVPLHEARTDPRARQGDPCQSV